MQIPPAPFYTDIDALRILYGCSMNTLSMLYDYSINTPMMLYEYFIDAHENQYTMKSTFCTCQT